MKYKNINTYILGLLVLLIVFAIYMQYSVNQSTKELKAEEIKKTKQYAKNIVQYIKQRVPKDLDKSLENDVALRHELNSVLQAFRTDKYKYIFVLDRKSDKYYRFLLDGDSSSKEDFHSMFLPRDNAYNDVYKHKYIEIIRQKDSKDIENLWISVLAPIVYDNNTQALLVLDLSKGYGEYLNNFNSPLQQLISLMRIFLVVSMFVFIGVLYINYKIRQNISIDKTTKAFTKQALDEFFTSHLLENYYAILIDIDELRIINTKFGYDAGDKILYEFVKNSKKILESYQDSKIFRIGGGEFIVILPKENIDLYKFSENFFSLISDKKYHFKAETIKVNISMSSIDISKDTTAWYMVLRILEEKLLDIKNRGKNSFDVISNNESNNIKYSDINYITKQLDNEAIINLYQPIFDTKTKEIIKYETLVRLYDKEEDKLISPYFFLEVIRGTSQYIKMSRLILNNVFNTLSKYPDIELSVNLHLDDLYNGEMMKTINHMLSTNQEYARRLTFEILEDKEIFDYDKVNSVFKKLKQFGSKIAIDDFGSGYANYIYFIKLDVDLIKIDGSIIKELKDKPDSTKEVIKSIKELANHFGCKVIAEFISDEEIYNYMLELDIRYSQGFYLGEPKPISEYID